MHLSLSNKNNFSKIPDLDQALISQRGRGWKGRNKLRIGLRSERKEVKFIEWNNT